MDAHCTAHPTNGHSPLYSLSLCVHTLDLERGVGADDVDGPGGEGDCV